MHEGRNQYDNELTRQLIKEGNANMQEARTAAAAAQSGQFGYFGLPQEPGETLPWDSGKAQRLVGVARTGQSWLEWMSGASKTTDFPLALEEKRRRMFEAANVRGRRRLTKRKGEFAQPAAQPTGRTRTRSEASITREIRRRGQRPGARARNPRYR